jgi:hypothetical protein
MKFWLDENGKVSKGRIIGAVIGFLFLLCLGIALIFPLQSTLNFLGW